MLLNETHIPSCEEKYSDVWSGFWFSADEKNEEKQKEANSATDE